MTRTLPPGGHSCQNMQTRTWFCLLLGVQALAGPDGFFEADDAGEVDAVVLLQVSMKPKGFDTSTFTSLGTTKDEVFHTRMFLGAADMYLQATQLSELGLLIGTLP